MDALEGLRGCRDRLTDLDKKILALLVERDDEARTVGAYKEVLGRPSHDEEQEEVMISSRRVMAEALGLDPDYVEELFRTVHDHSVQVQEVFREDLRNGPLEA